MANRQLFDIPGWGGINCLYNRALGEPSRGKNFITENGALFTRGGSSLVSGASFTNSIRSIHSAVKAGLTTRLLVEEGTHFWHRIDEGEDWVSLKNDVSGDHPFRSTIWSTANGDSFLLLVNGAQMLIYDIQDGMLSEMVNLAPDSDGVVPPMEHVVNVRGTGYVYTWAPNYPQANLLRYCGIDENQYPSIDYWPATNALDISGDASEPVLDFVQLNTYSLAFTTRGYYRIIGVPGNLNVSRAGNAGVYGGRVRKCAQLVGDIAIWLGAEKGIPKVYAYSGTQAYHISQKIDWLLREHSLADAWTMGIGNEFWLILPDSPTGKTTVFIFDVDEKGWYCFEYPAVFTSGCLFGAYSSREYPYMGLNDGRILRLDDNTTDFGNSITTEFLIGPISNSGQSFKGASLNLIANIVTDEEFDLEVYVKEDERQEYGPETVVFEGKGLQICRRVPLRGVTGQNLSLRIATTANINALLAGSITIEGKPVR